MDYNEYFGWVKDELENTRNSDKNIDLLHYTMGMTEEVGEFLKVFDKHFSHADIKNDEKFLEEAGDYLWYMTAYMILNMKGITTFIDLIYEHDRMEKYCQINALICDNAKLQGLYKKKLFFGKQVEEEQINEVFVRCFNGYFSMLNYLNIAPHDLAQINYNKLTSRYPNGRNSKYFISLNISNKNQ